METEKQSLTTIDFYGNLYKIYKYISMKKSLVTIRVRKGDIGRALKQFKRLVKESDHIQELKKRREYIKPTTVRRKQKQQAIRENDRLVKEQKERYE